MANDVSYFKVDGDSTTYSFNDADAETAIVTERARATAAEQDNATAISTETTRAEAVEGSLANLTTTAKGSLVAAINEVNGRIAAGQSAASVSITSNSYEERTYSFGNTFSAAPKVFLQLTGTGDNAYRGNVSAFVVSATTTTVTVRFFNASAATLSVGLNWLAVVS